MGKRLALPSLFDFATGGIRATFEAVSLYLDRDKLMERTPPGDGRPVIVVPGCFASDRSTIILRDFLNDKGFCAYGAQNGFNLGPSEDKLRHAVNFLDEVFNASGGRKVTFIGQSDGGIIFTREIARAFPDKVDQVITLESPFGADEHSEYSIRFMLHVYQFMYGGHRDFVGRTPVTDHLLDPLPVPTTAIYSQTGGVVNWRQCINPPGENCENVEIIGSHVGMGMNLQSLLVILDRLSQKSGEWAPFDRQKYPDAGFPARQAHEDYEIPSRPKRPRDPRACVFK